MKPVSRIPILLSAFACPGLGQMVQMRWKAGLVLFSGFLTGFCWVMILAIGNIVSYYAMVADPDIDPEVSEPSAFVVPISIAAVFYLLSLFDVISAHRVKASRSREEEFLNQHGSTDS